MVLPALLLVNWLMPVHSHDMPIRRIAVNITFAWRVWPVNMVAQLVQSSKLVIVMAPVIVRIPKMYPAGKLSNLSCMTTHSLFISTI